MNTEQKNQVRDAVESMTEQVPGNVKDVTLIFGATEALLHFVCFQNTVVGRGEILSFVGRFFRTVQITDFRGSTCTVKVTI